MERSDRALALLLETPRRLRGEEVSDAAVRMQIVEEQGQQLLNDISDAAAALNTQIRVASASHDAKRRRLIAIRSHSMHMEEEIVQKE